MGPDDKTIGQSNLFQRGKTWYANVRLRDGNRVKRSLGTEKIGEARLRLADILADIEDEAQEKTAPTFGQYAAGFFDPDSQWITRRAAQGHTLKESSRKLYAHILDSFLAPAWGGRDIASIKGPEVEAWCMTLGIGSSYKNETLRTIRIILDEAARDELRAAPVKIERFARDSKRKDILTDDELRVLFPADIDAMSQVWKTDFRFDEPNAGQMFGTMFLTMVSAGLRPGEVRALQPHHLFLDHGAIAITQAWNLDGELDMPKKGKAADPRFRVVMIPDRTVDTLRAWLPEAGEFLFQYWGRPVSRRLIGQRFDKGLTRAGINQEGRILTPHSLRYTYNTKMQMNISGDILREMIGHRDQAMTQHYSRPVIEDRIRQLQGHREGVNQFWT
jgi:integrase